MIDFLKKFFKPEGSSTTAKERLRLVLLSDHLSLAPDVVEALRRDLIVVISKYVEVDEQHCDVTFEQQDSAVAMLANIPILAMRSRPKPPPAAPRAPEPPPPSLDEAPTLLAKAADDPNDDASTGPAPATPAKRRKRRRHTTVASVTVPSPSA
jgi:cell division topological specificity factor